MVDMSGALENQPANSAAKLSDLVSIRPTNEAVEREKFIASLAAGEKYEPQLKYPSATRAEAVRAKCDEHLSDEFAELARAILDGVIRDHGSEEKYQASVWGQPLETDQVQQACDEYLAANELTDKVSFVWSPETLVTMCAGSKVHLVTRPGYYREKRLSSLLDHEVGTHFVRSHNHKQAFAGKRWAARRGWLLATEEGLATLNTHLTYSDKRIWIPALHYHAALLASKLPFSELWKELGKYLGADDHERLWTTCLRVKRGVSDTGEPIGYYKDQSNFAGAIVLLKQRHSVDFELLHCVRVSIEDFPSVSGVARNALAAGSVLRPAFVRDDAAYRAALDEMAVANGLA